MRQKWKEMVPSYFMQTNRRPRPRALTKLLTRLHSVLARATQGSRPQSETSAYKALCERVQRPVTLSGDAESHSNSKLWAFPWTRLALALDGANLPPRPKRVSKNLADSLVNAQLAANLRCRSFAVREGDRFQADLWLTTSFRSLIGSSFVRSLESFSSTGAAASRKPLVSAPTRLPFIVVVVVVAR